MSGDKARTGVPGLDDILVGGLATGRIFLLEGNPGTGKTTMALSFLREGAKLGERCLYITLSETEQELRAGAESHGWELGEQIEVFEVVPPESLLDADQQQSLLYSSDLELGETTKAIFAAAESSKAVRVVIDSLSEIRLLAQSSLRYRRQILAMKHYFARHGATVLLLDDLTADPLDKTVHSVAAGVIRLEEKTPDYGAERRRLRVVKYRTQSYRGGYHDFIIRAGGAQVFPRLVAAEHRRDFARGRLTSGIPRLDALLGGGIETGSSSLLLGPAGAGKSVITLQFVAHTIAKGGKAAMFVFDEELGLLFERAKPLGYDLAALRDSGRLEIHQLDARPRLRARRGRQDGRHRQPERLPGVDAPGERLAPAHSRAAAILQSAGRLDLPDGGAAWAGGRDEEPCRHHLSRRFGDPAALLRSRRLGAPRHLGHQEANRQARRHDSRILDRRRAASRRAAVAVPWRAARHADVSR